MNKYLKYFKKQIFVITIVLILRQLFLVLGQHLNAETFTNIVNKDLYKFLIVVLITVLLWTVIIVSDKVMSVYEEQTKQSIGVKIRESISEKIVATKYDEFSKNSTGNYISWLNNDIENIMQNGISSYFNLIRGVAGIIFASTMLIYYHWFLLILTLLGFVAMMYIPKMFNKSIEQIGGEVTKENEKFMLEIEDSLNGYKTLFSYSLTNNFIKRIVNASNSLKNILVKKAKLYSNITAVNFSINVVFQIILTLVAGIFYFKGYIEIGVVAAVGALADIVFSGLSGVSYQIASIKSVEPIFKKYGKLSKENVEKLSTIDTTEIYRLENVGLGYEKGKNILNNFSMAIEKNKKYLIQGDSGSGKSTLLKLLLGYLPDYKGEIFYKNINLKNISSKNIAKEVCYLNQETHIFTGTIRDNITLGQQFSNNKVMEVLSLVGLESNMIDKFVGIQGSELSGGQKQKVSLARALIRNPKILLLDEITSALDKESTLMIEKLVLTMRDVTVLMITHKIYKETEILFDEIYNL